MTTCPQNKGAKTVRDTFLPFSRPSISEAAITEVVDSLRSGWITSGPKVARFEEAFADYVGVRHAVAVSSGTAGLHLSLLALELEPGDEVILPPLTWPATANAIVLAGGTPVFADIEATTWNLSPEAAAAKVTPRTRALAPVHFAGRPCELDELHALARRHGLVVVEDAAHAAGTEYKGRRVGGLSWSSVFSFHPIKNMTTAEGGMVTTNEDDLAEGLRLLRFHGVTKDAYKRSRGRGPAGYDTVRLGLKYNLTDLQAALGIHQLQRLDEFCRRREQLARRYQQELADLPGLTLPAPVPPDQRHAWHLYTVLVDPAETGVDRDSFMARLARRNVGTGLHFTAVHLHTYYRKRYAYEPGACPAAERVCSRIVSLPLYPAMTDADQTDVIAAVRRVLRS